MRISGKLVTDVRYVQAGILSAGITLFDFCAVYTVVHVLSASGFIPLSVRDFIYLI